MRRRRPAPAPAPAAPTSPLVAHFAERAAAGDEWARQHVESLNSGRVDLAAFTALSVLDPTDQARHVIGREVIP